MNAQELYEYICPICGRWTESAIDYGDEERVCAICFEGDWDPADGEIEFDSP